MKFFTSDLHLSHGNIIRYCRRPFSTTQEMDEQLIENFKSVLRPGDELYILGDLSFQFESSINFLREVPGQKFMVWGNHDPKKAKDREIIQSLCVKTADIMEVKFKDGKQAVLCHYPMLRWNKGHFGSFMLHGHTHGDCEYTQDMRILDVGVDNNVVLHPKYYPWSEEEVSRYMKTVPWTKHHYFQEEEHPVCEHGAPASYGGGCGMSCPVNGAKSKEPGCPTCGTLYKYGNDHSQCAHPAHDFLDGECRKCGFIKPDEKGWAT